MNSYKKIVITGASGFLGSHLVERLKGKRCLVYALSSKPEQLKEKIGGENIEYIQKDVLDKQMLKDSIVISCAYPRNSTGTEVADGLRYIKRVFESAVQNKAAAIINISSQSVYSQQRLEVATEETPLCLESIYAVGKYAVELMLEGICRESKTNYTSLRMASLIGPRFDQRIVNRFVKKMMNGEVITVVQQPKRMGFLDVEDAVNAIIAVSNTSVSSWQSVYNVGNGIAYTVEEIYEAVAAEMKIRTTVSSPILESGNEISSTAVSYEQLKIDTGFIPSIDLNESIKRIIAQI